MRKNFLAAAVALSLPCALAHAQGGYVGPRAYDLNSPKHTVSGSLVNSATGEPLPRAPVMITGDVSSLVLKLTPEGIVAGTITGDDGEPLEGVYLRLKHQVINNGRKQWETRSQPRTNENGEFRVANLIPGTYYMVAQAQRPSTPRAAAEPNIGYAPSYYPGTPDLASAFAIEARGGQTVQIEFRLRSQPVWLVHAFGGPSGTLHAAGAGKWMGFAVGDAAMIKPFLANGEPIVVDTKGNHNMRVKVQ